MRRRVAIVGAGWSGLACALDLHATGVAVTLFDAAPQVGGRARAVHRVLGDREYTLDNGQHLLIGAYRETLRLMREAGVDPDQALLRLPLAMRYPDGFELRARRLPAPLHMAAALLTARGLNWAERRQAISFVARWRRRGWRLDVDQPAAGLFADAPQPLVRRLWRPLCLAALNVELHAASAQVMLAVLRDSLDAMPSASDFLIPRRDLSATFAEPAVQMLRRRGAAIRLRCPVQRIERVAVGWRLHLRDGQQDVDAVVLALPPARAAELLASAQAAALDEPVAELQAIAAEPIVTVYLRYAPGIGLPFPACALLDDAAASRYGQWVFDRGQLDRVNEGVFSVVISAGTTALQLEPPQLAATVGRQLTDDLGLPAPLASSVIAEKRATIVPSPGLRRPPARLPVPALYLAGDAAASEYPSTLEGSVRAGVAAARALGDDWTLTP